MSLEREFVEAFTKTWGNICKKEIDNMEIEVWPLAHQKKGVETVKVTYKGFTGELGKLERTHYGDCRYSLSIYDSEKNVTHSFTGVNLEDVKFLGGLVSFCND